MYRFIVIGNPINHSKSPAIHSAFAHQAGLDISYHRQLCPNDFDSFVAVVEAFFYGGGTGANVTLPFKEWAWQLCKERGMLSDFADTAGAVNTLTIKDGNLYGDNTDGRGLVADLIGKKVPLQEKKVAILGAGGAARGAILPLLQAGANLSIFNRTTQKAQTLVSEFQLRANTSTLTAHSLNELSGQFDIIINATSTGTNNQSLNLTNQDSVQVAIAYDMMYGKETEFLRQFKDKAVCYDGLGMLIEQAKFAFELWTGASIDLALLDFEQIVR